MRLELDKFRQRLERVFVFRLMWVWVDQLFDSRFQSRLLSYDITICVFPHALACIEYSSTVSTCFIVFLTVPCHMAVYAASATMYNV